MWFISEIFAHKVGLSFQMFTIDLHLKIAKNHENFIHVSSRQTQRHQISPISSNCNKYVSAQNLHRKALFHLQDGAVQLELRAQRGRAERVQRRQVQLPLHHVPDVRRRREGDQDLRRKVTLNCMSNAVKHLTK